MDWLLRTLSENDIAGWETFIGDWFFVIAMAFLLFELIRYAIKRKLSGTLIGDTLTNFVTLALFLGISALLLTTFYISAYLWVSQYGLIDIPVNWVSVIICVILADFAYYWEHRFMHRVNIAWATHSVHHSSPFFNISVAYRFGPMDGVWPIFFHLPLVLLGFNPFVVFFAEMFVQLYQTLLHTEVIKRLPRPVEAVMNTPSHHRVHHGSNRKYLDKNYAGIFIIWDRWFGTFAKEDDDVVYGLVKPLNSVNPFVAFFHGFWRLGKNVASMKGLRNKFLCLVRGPEWAPEHPVE